MNIPDTAAFPEIPPANSDESPVCVSCAEARCPSSCVRRKRVASDSEQHHGPSECTRCAALGLSCSWKLGKFSLLVDVVGCLSVDAAIGMHAQSVHASDVLNLACNTLSKVTSQIKAMDAWLGETESILRTLHDAAAGRDGNNAASQGQ